MIQQTIFDTQPDFVPSNAPQETTKSKPGIETRPSVKTVQERPGGDEDELFSDVHASDDLEKAEQLISLMKKHSSIVSVSRTGTKVMDRAFLCARQLLAGEFLFAYTWDRSWFNRVESSYPAVKAVRFDDWDSLMAKMDDTLGYVEERQPYGYWYPSKKDGKLSKVSLADFIAHPMKNKNWMSPFIEIACTDMVTPRMYRDSLGKNACMILDKILDRAWFSKDFKTMVNFYKNVSSLKKRHDMLTKGMHGSDSYYLSSFVGFLDEIRKCDEETGCVGPNFIGPWSNKWGVLKSWFYKVHHISL